MDRILILLPSYNEAPRLPDTIRRIRKSIEKLNKFYFEILVVDDGSKDETSEVALKENVKVIRHNKNLGKGYVHRTGFKYALEKNFDAVLTLDADGQHDPAEIENFLKVYDKYDMIIGKRRVDVKVMPLIRYFTNRLTSLVTSVLSEKKVSDSQSGYRLLKRSVFEKLRLKTSRFQTESEEIIQAGRFRLKIAEVNISTIYRESGRKSYINPFIDTIRFIQMGIDSLWR
jgi:glycosyltransferase involved in cell wall biosynthesis|uniref:Glycosyltransferase family 2 protein n=1 Tax=candidate division WOR-3 bacterium TaxID=2052148 RepID=A0A7C4UD34_UNCW3